MKKLTETQFKQEKGRLHISNFLSAMKFHDHDLKNTIKLMRKRLLEIQQKKSAPVAASVLIKKPTACRKIVFKFGGSKTSVFHERPHPSSVLHKRPHSQTLVSVTRDIKIDSRSASTSVIGSSHSKSLLCKRHKVKNNTNEGVNHVMGFIRSVGGSEAELVIEKRLTMSDVNRNLGRLLIPELQVKNVEGLLTADEDIKLGQKGGSISVSVFDPERRKLTLNLSKWSMSKECYVLKTNWNQVVKTNGLKEEMVIRVFSFRVCEKLCFALDRVE